MENDIFWSEIGSGFGEPGGTPPPRISRSAQPPGGIVSPSEFSFSVVLELEKRIALRPNEPPIRRFEITLTTFTGRTLSTFLALCF